MKYLILLALLWMCSLTLCAQQYASTTDANGNKNYWRIYSACEAYKNKCIQDNSTNSTYTFYVNDYSASNAKQRFEFVSYASDTTKYYIRNASSRNFFFNNVIVKNPYCFLMVASAKYNTTPFTITPIGGNQVLISFEMTDGTTYYLNAADDNTVGQKVYIEDALNSRYAWYITDAEVDPTGIQDVLVEDEVQVNVLDKHIIVAGCKDYSIYDVMGRQQPLTGQRATGMYIVKTPGKNFKIWVR